MAVQKKSKNFRIFLSKLALKCEKPMFTAISELHMKILILQSRTKILTFSLNVWKSQKNPQIFFKVLKKSIINNQIKFVQKI